MIAICIKCGAQKKRSIDQCGGCGFVPQTDEEKAKSLIISSDYEIQGEYLGKTIEELRAVSADILTGKPHEFKADEVRAVIAYANEVMAIPAKTLFFDGVKWLGPPVVILIALFLILFMAQ